jgi:hypothetical protein
MILCSGGARTGIFKPEYKKVFRFFFLLPEETLPQTDRNTLTLWPELILPHKAISL